MKSRRTICLNDDKTLRIYMLPLRQTLLHEMAVIGTPVTGKQIADLLGISPSSAHHHIKQLELIGLIEFDHYQNINGIRARYVRLADVDVSIGLDQEDSSDQPRNALLFHYVNQAYSGFMQRAATMKKSLSCGDPVNPLNDILSYVVHFTEDESRLFYQQLRNALTEHEKPKEGTKPWNFLMISYQENLPAKTPGTAKESTR